MIKTLRLVFKNGAYRSIAFCFMSLNFLFGTWAIYIPSIKNKLDLDEGQLGMAILFLGIGTFSMLLVAPTIVRYLHAGRSLTFSMYAFFLSFLLPFYAESYFMLCLGLLFVGIFSGLMDISMNTCVSELERKDNVMIMSANHGFFSLGGMISAGIGTLFMPVASSPFLHMLAVGLITAFINTLNLKHLYGLKSDIIEKNSFDPKLFKPLILVVLIGFLVMSAEGAVVDWGALFLEKMADAPEYMVGLGYTSFSLFMALGRFLGDGISQKFGSAKLIMLGCTLALLGFGLVLSAHTFTSILGFGVVGLGLSVVVPELFRIGGNTPNIDAAQGISLIAGSGFIGFLIGPVLLGFLAKIWDLKISFWALFFFTFLSLVLTFVLWKRNKNVS